MVLTLYNLENSRSFRVHWLIEELGADVKIRNYARVEGKRAVPEMAKDSGFKLGKSPVLVEDGDGDKSKAYFVYESANCLIYLIERFQPKSEMLPPTSDLAARTKVLGLTEFAENMMLHALPVVYSKWYLSDEKAIAEMGEKCTPNIENDFEELERTLAESKGPYFMGKQMTIADVALGFSVEFIMSLQIGNKGKQETRWPHVRAWAKEIESRPAYKKALKEGGKYDFCLN